MAFSSMTRALSRAAVKLSRNYSQSANGPVGFIGLGNMGLPMARNLVAKGHKLVLYDISQERMNEVGGGEGVGSPAEVASKAETVITMLPTGNHVMQCYSGENGLLSAIKPGSLLIDSSTIAPEEARSVAQLAEKHSVDFIDAPVSGGVGAATKGILAFLVGGASESYTRATPILEGMGKTIIHCGDHGNGQSAKVCNNMLLAIGMIGTSEAIQLGIRLGLEPEIISKVINSASGRCWSSEVYNPCPGIIDTVPSSNEYRGGFGTALMTKDLGLAQSVANSSGAMTPLGSLALQIYRLMCQSGYSDKDFSSVFKFLENKQ